MVSKHPHLRSHTSQPSSDAVRRTCSRAWGRWPRWQLRMQKFISERGDVKDIVHHDLGVKVIERSPKSFPSPEA